MVALDGFGIIELGESFVQNTGKVVFTIVVGLMALIRFSLSSGKK